ARARARWRVRCGSTVRCSRSTCAFRRSTSTAKRCAPARRPARAIRRPGVRAADRRARFARTLAFLEVCCDDADMVKTAKKTGAGTRAAERSGPPIHIRNFGAPITADDRDYVRQKLAARLAPFGKRVERASVRIEDVNGPRGGIDKRCRIKVVLSGVTSVTAEEQEAVLRIAID